MPIPQIDTEGEQYQHGDIASPIVLPQHYVPFTNNEVGRAAGQVPIGYRQWLEFAMRRGWALTLAIAPKAIGDELYRKHGPQIASSGPRTNLLERIRAEDGYADKQDRTAEMKIIKRRTLPSTSKHITAVANQAPNDDGYDEPF